MTRQAAFKRFGGPSRALELLPQRLPAPGERFERDYLRDRRFYAAMDDTTADLVAW